jgi:hypothetical protein
MTLTIRQPGRSEGRAAGLDRSLSTLDALREAEPGITGKRSILSALQKSLGSLAPDERAPAGALLQEARREVEAALERQRES